MAASVSPKGDWIYCIGEDMYEFSLDILFLLQIATCKIFTGTRCPFTHFPNFVFFFVASKPCFIQYNNLENNKKRLLPNN